MKTILVVIFTIIHVAATVRKGKKNLGTKELLSKLEHSINMEAKDILAKINVHRKLVKKLVSKVVDKKKTNNTTYATNFTSKMKKALKDYRKHIPNTIENNSTSKNNNITPVNNSVPSTSLKLAKSKPVDMSQDVYGNTMGKNNSHIFLHKASLRNVSHHKGHNNYHNKTIFPLLTSGQVSSSKDNTWNEQNLPQSNHSEKIPNAAAALKAAVSILNLKEKQSKPTIQQKLNQSTIIEDLQRYNAEKKVSHTDALLMKLNRHEEIDIDTAMNKLKQDYRFVKKILRKAKNHKARLQHSGSRLRHKKYEKLKYRHWTSLKASNKHRPSNRTKTSAPPFPTVSSITPYYERKASASGNSSEYSYGRPIVHYPSNKHRSSNHTKTSAPPFPTVSSISPYYERKASASGNPSGHSYGLPIVHYPRKDQKGQNSTQFNNSTFLPANNTHLLNSSSHSNVLPPSYNLTKTPSGFFLSTPNLTLSVTKVTNEITFPQITNYTLDGLNNTNASDRESIHRKQHNYRFTSGYKNHTKGKVLHKNFHHAHNQHRTSFKSYPTKHFQTHAMQNSLSFLPTTQRNVTTALNTNLKGSGMSNQNSLNYISAYTYQNASNTRPNGISSHTISQYQTRNVTRPYVTSNQTINQYQIISSTRPYSTSNQTINQYQISYNAPPTNLSQKQSGISFLPKAQSYASSKINVNNVDKAQVNKVVNYNGIRNQNSHGFRSTSTNHNFSYGQPFFNMHNQTKNQYHGSSNVLPASQYFHQVTSSLRPLMQSNLSSTANTTITTRATLEQNQALHASPRSYKNCTKGNDIINVSYYDQHLHQTAHIKMRVNESQDQLLQNVIVTPFLFRGMPYGLFKKRNMSESVDTRYRHTLRLVNISSKKSLPSKPRVSTSRKINVVKEHAKIQLGQKPVTQYKKLKTSNGAKKTFIRTMGSPVLDATKYQSEENLEIEKEPSNLTSDLTSKSSIPVGETVNFTGNTYSGFLSSPAEKNNSISSSDIVINTDSSSDLANNRGLLPQNAHKLRGQNFHVPRKNVLKSTKLNSPGLQKSRKLIKKGNLKKSSNVTKKTLYLIPGVNQRPKLPVASKENLIQAEKKFSSIDKKLLPDLDANFLLYKRERIVNSEQANENVDKETADQTAASNTSTNPFESLTSPSNADAIEDPPPELPEPANRPSSFSPFEILTSSQLDHPSQKEAIAIDNAPRPDDEESHNDT